MKNGVVFHYTTLTNQLSVEINFPKVDLHTGGKRSTNAPNTTRAASYKDWNSPVEYPSWEYEFDIKVQW